MGNLDVGEPRAGANSDSKQDTCQRLWLAEGGLRSSPSGFWLNIPG